jgi:homopolymeric O-antigen transport system ATP-binding protein
MSDTAVEFNAVWKKFKKGETFDSLRDLVPAMAKRLFSARYGQELHEREFWAVKDVSFEVRRGEALGIIGANGAGKSTILKLLSKILKPTKGTICVRGRLSALIEVGAGFHPDLSGRENVYLNGAILGMTREEISKKFDEIVEFSGLGDFIDTPVKRYSSGMYARLGFSVASHVDPEVLLVDEVLSVGDFPFQTKCIKWMQETIKKGTTVVFISHNVPSVVQLCPRTILMNKGGVSRIGPSPEVCRFYYQSWADAQPAANKVCVSHTQLEADDGSPCNVFKPGEWGRLRVAVTSAEPADELIAAFLVKRNDGLVLFDANSDKISHTYYSFEPHETKEVSIRFRANLPAGTYYVGVHFLKPMEGFYFYNDELVELYVAGPSTMGFAFLDTKWR